MLDIENALTEYYTGSSQFRNIVRKKYKQGITIQCYKSWRQSHIQSFVEAQRRII